MPIAWKEVVSKPEYQALQPQQKTEAMAQYFNDVVSPNVPQQDIQIAQSQFMGYAQSLNQPEQLGFIDSFKQEVGAIKNEYIHAIEHPIDTANSIGNAFSSVADNPAAASEALVQMYDEAVANPSGTAGMLLAQIVNPASWISLGAGGVAAKIAAKTASRTAATVAGAATGAATAGTLNVADIGARASAEGRQLQAGESGAAAMLGAGLGGVFSVPVARMASKGAVAPKLEPTVNKYESPILALEAPVHKVTPEGVVIPNDRSKPSSDVGMAEVKNAKHGRVEIPEPVSYAKTNNGRVRAFKSKETAAKLAQGKKIVPHPDKKGMYAITESSQGSVPVNLPEGNLGTVETPNVGIVDGKAMSQVEADKAAIAKFESTQETPLLTATDTISSEMPVIDDKQPDIADNKQAWEMTKEEYINSEVIKNKGRPANETSIAAEAVYPLHVRKAIEDGKPVSKEVISYYKKATGYADSDISKLKESQTKPIDNKDESSLFGAEERADAKDRQGTLETTVNVSAIESEYKKYSGIQYRIRTKEITTKQGLKEAGVKRKIDLDRKVVALGKDLNAAKAGETAQEATVKPQESAPTEQGSDVPLFTTYTELESNKRGDIYRQDFKGAVKYLVSHGENRGAGDTIHNTLEEAKSEVALLSDMDKQDKSRLLGKENAEKKIKDAEKEFNNTPLGKHLSTLSLMKAGRVKKALAKKVNHKARGVISKSKWIEMMVEEGYKLETITDNSSKTAQIQNHISRLDKGMMTSTTAKNEIKRLEQEMKGGLSIEHERLVAPDGGYVDARDVTKLGLEYAKSLLAKDTQKEKSPKQAESPKAKIEDFGSKIGGAAKDLYGLYSDKMDKAGNLDIATVPLSKSFPEPNYHKLIESGANSRLVSYARVLREDVPDKPRGRYARTSMIRKYVEDVNDARQKAEQAIRISMEGKSRALNDAMIPKDIEDKVALYEAVGHEKSLKGMELGRRFYTLYKGEKDVTFWSVETKGVKSAFSNMPRELAHADTKEEAIKQFKAWHAIQQATPKEPKGIKFSVYKMRRTGKSGIGKDVGRHQYFFKDDFENAKEARAYLNEHHAEIEEHFKVWKELPDHRRDTNNPRIGDDHRDSKDVTPEMFTEAFGFRGVEFGNWVSKSGERQGHLNRAYDALMDLATLLNIPTKAISLDGELGLAFGARGRKGAAAHYERDSVVINLTRKQGAGSLAHEWFHALDNYVSRNRNQADGFITEKPYKQFKDSTRSELLEAFKELQLAISNTGLKERSSKLDTRKTKEYWGTGREMNARAFESYIIKSLGDQKYSNDYLANIVSEKAWVIEEEYPYIKASEIKVIKDAFDNLFKTFKTKETNQGTALYSKGKASGLTTTQAKQTLTKTFGSAITRAINNGKVVIVKSASELPLGYNKLHEILFSKNKRVDNSEKGRARGELRSGEEAPYPHELTADKSIKLYIADMQKRLGNGEEIRFVPQAVYDYIDAGGDIPGVRYSNNGSIMGAYDDATKTTYIVADNNSESTVASTFLHEASHAFFDSAKGRRVKDNAISQIIKAEKLSRSGKGKVAAWILQAKKAVPRSTKLEHYYEEILAYAVQQHQAKEPMPLSIRNIAVKFLNEMKAFIVRHTNKVYKITPELLTSIARQNLGKFSRQAVEKSTAKSEGIKLSKSFEEGKAIAKDVIEGKAKGMAEVSSAIGRAFYTRPVQQIRNIGTDAAKKIGDLIYKEERHEKRAVEGYDLIQRRSQKEGEYGQRLTSILDSISGRFGVRKADSEALVKGLNSPKGTIAKRLSSQFDDARKLLDDIRDYMKDAGVDIGYIKNYFPRVYDTKKLTMHKTAFIRLLNKHGIKDAVSVYRRIVENDGFLVHAGDSSRVEVNQYGERRVMHEGKASKTSMEKERKLDIPYDELKRFLVNDYGAIMARYVHHATRRAEFARTFGDNEQVLNKLAEQVVEDYANGKADGNMDVRTALSVIYGLADDLQGRGMRFDTEGLNIISRGISNVSIMIYLPLVAMASFPEFLAPALKGGLKHYPKALVKGIVDGLTEATAAADKLVTGKRHISKTEWRKNAELMGAVSQHAINEVWQRRFGGATSKATSKFMRATMLEQMTNIQKIIASEMAKSIIKDISRKDTQQARMEMKDFGLESKPTDEDISFAAQRWAQQAITDPNEATTPRLLTHPGVNLIFQFKRFITVFSNTLLKSVLQNIVRYPSMASKAQVIIPAIGMIAIAYYTQYLRDYIKYGDKEPPFRRWTDTVKRWMDAVDRAGLTGVLSTLYMLANPYRYGFTDNSKSRIFNLMGAPLNAVAKTADILTGTGSSKPRKRAKAITSLIPVVNAIAPLRKATEKKIRNVIR